MNASIVFSHSLRRENLDFMDISNYKQLYKIVNQPKKPIINRETLNNIKECKKFYENFDMKKGYNISKTGEVGGQNFI